MFSFNAIYISLLHKSRVTVTESYISMTVFVRSKNVLVKASDIFLLLFPFSWNYAGTLLSSVYKTYGGPLLYLDSTKSASPKRNENATTINVLVPGPHTLVARTGPHLSRSRHDFATSRFRPRYLYW